MTLLGRVEAFLGEPLVEAIILAVIWVINIVYGVADPAALYGRF